MKRFSKLILPFLISAVGVVSGVTGVWGLYSETVSVHNHVETGDINIRIEDYETQGNMLKPFQNNPTVLPGDTVSKIVQVKNLAETCWIRCKVTFGKDKNGKSLLSMDNIRGISEKWVRQGEYYYYTEPVDRQKYAEFFKEVYIPESWDSSYAEELLSIGIRADAIQKEGFQPDFSALSPWGNQEIQQCIHEVDNKTIKVQKNIKPSVVFSGNAHRLVAAPDDFFGNMPQLMPGSSFTDRVILSNQGSTASELFFGTALESVTPEEKDLLEHLDLTIGYKGKELYRGPLSSEKLSEMVSLGNFGPGEKGELVFTVTMPKELDNAFARRAANVVWLFSVKADESTPGSGYKSGGSGYESAGHGGSAGLSYGNSTASVKTGDTSDTQIYVLLLMLSVSCVCLAVFLKRRILNEVE